MPKYRKFRMPNRPWVCNISNSIQFLLIVYTKLGSDFKTLVDGVMKDREKFLIMKRSFDINVLPEFAEGFSKSNRVSSMPSQLICTIVVNGRSNFQQKHPQSKRSKPAEMKDLEMMNFNLDKNNAELAMEIEDLNRKVVELRTLHIEDLHYKEKIEELIQKGVLNENGEEVIKF